MKIKSAVLVSCFFAAVVLSGCGKNSPNGTGLEKSEQKGVPADSLSICNGKNEGDGCEISMPKDSNSDANKVSGVCKKSPSGDQLACMPQDGGPGGEKPSDVAGAKK